ncbi:vWA domain-containing protein [Clostridium taeniosporum]|uniref:VWA domain-containing protein n=1 Tax=Clostridium taeniosporum TaxID=394958 RepID=A0A1D7XMR4_9CLOT|nr:vWA domain-containing protein [Clostridium taeniosporum]AOR24622.1 VWA domain-containing protein [Clostridium taeniosporum]
MTKIKEVFINYYKKRKEAYKVLSIFLVVILIATFVNIRLINANADNSIGDKPSFQIQIDKADPNPALLGEDICIKGKIIPKPFEMEIERQKKEIVLVLDTSGSMDEKVAKICTHKRVRHKVDGHYEWHGYYKVWVDPYYIDNYCEEHGTAEEHYSSYTTKMAELKKAANNFIDKMKGIPDLKIGIVNYSSEATINPFGYYRYKNSKSIDQYYSHEVPDYKSLGKEFLDSKDSRLHDMVNKLKALGGTNTGEGLRKAEYMLEQGDKDAKKTIVFMSDGLPTFYSAYKTNEKVKKYHWVKKYSLEYGYYWSKEYYWENEYYWDYYTSIDDTYPNYAGTGNSDDKGYCKDYAKKIGEIIKNSKSNVFSIGYGLGNENSKSNKIMREIHDSMGGLEKDFFATDAGVINNIFDKIADKIIESYTIDNLEMDMNFKSEDGFTLKVGGNTVKLNNVIYKKVSENNGKIRYEANEVPFEFVIKGSKVGEYENIFKNSKGEFLWKDNVISIPIITSDDFVIKIRANELPYIQVKLISEENINSKNINEEIEVKYEIMTKPFKYNIDSPLTISDAQLNFDLGDNFKLIESGNLEKIDESGNKYKVQLDKIEYELQKEGEDQGQWIQTKPIEVKFKIKKATNSGYGKLGFGKEKNNTILYTNFNEKRIINNINTPIVNFEGFSLRHGIYNGINNDGTVNINTTTKSYPKEARINLGADFIYNGQRIVQLNVDKNIYIDGPIKIYKLYGNKLNLLYSIDKTAEQKNYKIDLNKFGLNNGDKVLILYNEYAPNISGTFTNAIQVDASPSVNATINVIDEEIPELF